MANNAVFLPVDRIDESTSNGFSKIGLSVLTKINYYNHFGEVEKVSFLVDDVQRSRLEMVVDSSIVPVNKEMLREGALVAVENFEVFENSKVFPLANHGFRIRLKPDSVIGPYEGTFYSGKYQFQSFEEVKNNEFLMRHALIDVVGVVVKTEPDEFVGYKKVRVTLEDEWGQELELVLFGDHAMEFCEHKELWFPTANLGVEPVANNAFGIIVHLCRYARNSNGGIGLATVPNVTRIIYDQSEESIEAFVDSYVGRDDGPENGPYPYEVMDNLFVPSNTPHAQRDPGSSSDSADSDESDSSEFALVPAPKRRRTEGSS